MWLDSMNAENILSLCSSELQNCQGKDGSFLPEQASHGGEGLELLTC